MPKRPTGKRRPVQDSAPDVPAAEDALPIADEALREEMSSGAPHEPAEAAQVEQAAAEAAQAEADAAADLATAALDMRDDPAARPSPRREGWRKRSATGAILTGFAMGLQEVFEPEKKEPAIVMETSGDPPRDLPVEAELEVATTRRSVVRIRPWLLDDGADDTGGPVLADEPPPADRPAPGDGA